MSATATIRAQEPGCTCHRKWFACTCGLVTTTYTAQGDPWATDCGRPTPAFVAHVARLLPGWTLIYTPALGLAIGSMTYQQALAGGR